MSDFKEGLKVSKDQIPWSASVIENLNKQENVYNTNASAMSARTNYLRAGEFVFLQRYANGWYTLFTK